MMQSTSATSNHDIPKGVVIAIFLCTLGMIAFLPSLSDFVVKSGNHFGYAGDDLEVDYVLGILWAVILFLSIFFWPVPPEDRKALLLIWPVKAFIALVLMLAYEYQYALDPDGYYTNAISPQFIFDGLVFGNGTFTIQNLTWLHLQIVPGSYHGAKVGFSMLSLVGIYVYYRAAVIFLERKDLRILYVLAFFPSILFWSSILGKDPVTLFGISIYVYGVVAFYCFKKPKYLITLVAGVIIVSLLRMTLGVIMMVPLSVLIIVGKTSLKQRLLIISVFALSLFMVLSKLQGDLNILVVNDLFDFQNYAIGAFAGGGSTIQANRISGFGGTIIGLPLAIFTALFRPMFWEAKNLFSFLQSLDNLFLFLLLFVAIKRTKWRELADPLLLWAVVLILLWAALYGLVVFNLGTLARYKLQILPVFLGVLLYLSRRRDTRVG